MPSRTLSMLYVFYHSIITCIIGACSECRRRWCDRVAGPVPGGHVQQWAFNTQKPLSEVLQGELSVIQTAVFILFWLINLFAFIFGYCFININWRDVQRNNVVNNVDMSSLWARWQNGPHKKKQNSTKGAKQQYWRTLGINCWLPINSLSTIFTDPRFTKSFIRGFDTYWYCILMYYGLLPLHYNFLLIWNVS